MQTAVIWLIGWVMFAGIEIASRMLNWLPLAGFVPVLMLVLYAGLGIVLGGTLGALSFLVLKSVRKKVHYISLMRFIMTSCITAIDQQM